MPRTSRHKSSKHSSRNATDYSDSEKESSAKDRKSKEESVSRVSKECGSSEKRKHDSKEKRENDEEYYSSKRQKERIDEGPIDRWNGGGEDERGDGSRKSKDKSSESKSRRREEESEEAVKKNGGNSEGKHRELISRKEGREGSERDREKDRERKRKGKEGRGQRMVEVENLQEARQVSERNKLSAHDKLQSPEPENQSDKRIRRRKEDSRDGDKDQDVEDIPDRKVFSRDDVSKDGRKDEKLKDKRYKDSYRENLGKEGRQHDEKQKDEHSVKDHISSMSDDKKLRDDIATKTWQKKSKPQDSNDPDYEHDRDRDYDLGRDRENRSRGRDRERDRDRYREHNRDRDHERDRDQNVDNDGMNSNDHKYKDSRGRKTSPDDHDDYDDIKFRDTKTSRYEMDKISSGGSRVEADFDGARSRSRQSHIDNNVRSNRQKPFASNSSHGTGDEYRQFKVEESKFREGTPDQKSLANSLKEGAGGSTDRSFKYKSNGKPAQMEDGPSGDFSLGRSSSSKTSPMALMDRSPSSTSLERRYNRTRDRRSVDVEESGKRMSDSRELPSAEERPRRNLSFEKPVVDEPTPADASYYNRTSQGNFALNPPPSGFRGRVSSPLLLGSHEEDSRNKAGTRYRSSGDPNYGRGQGNAWRGNPNWSSPLPNGFIPYPHVPPHAGFQSMMPQFPSPPLFGVRPSLEINHPRMPYHIPDADRFSSHLQMGWQNVMDGASHANLHGWDGNNGVFTNEPHMYGGPEWDHHMNGRGWEAGGEQNGDVNMDLHKVSPKVEFPLQSSVDAEHSGERSQIDTNHELPMKNIETNSAVTYLESESNKALPGSTHEKPIEHCATDDDRVDRFCQVYLAKFDNLKEMAGPELYGQFTSVLNVEESPITEATAVLVNLKDGGRAVRKRDIGFLSPSLFPATNDSIYKRAMGIYKKQKVGSGFTSVSNNGLIDDTMVSETKLVATSADDMENKTRPGLDVKQTLNSNQMKADIPITADPEMSEAMNSTLSEEVHMHDSMPPGLKEVQALPLSHDSPEKDLEVGVGTGKDKMPSVPISSDDKECAKGIDSIEDANTTHSLSDCPSLDEKIKQQTETDTVDVGTQNFSGNALFDPMLISDGSRSPRETGDLKPELSESESAVISRIHHSPESTH